jgi:hypothetical protein
MKNKDCNYMTANELNVNSCSFTYLFNTNLMIICYISKYNIK